MEQTAATRTAAVAVPALSFEHVSCAFAERNGAGRYIAVKDASFGVAPGEFVSVVGPTGCGKSTLLNVAAGLLAPSAGRVLTGGRPLRGINRHAGYMLSICHPPRRGYSRACIRRSGWHSSVPSSANTSAPPAASAI
jgi:ABC-type glutathione transport system ATPase component